MEGSVWQDVFTKEQRTRLSKRAVGLIGRLRAMLKKSKLVGRDGFDLSAVGDHYLFIYADGTIVLKGRRGDYGETRFYEDPIEDHELAEFIAIYRVDPVLVQGLIDMIK